MNAKTIGVIFLLIFASGVQARTPHWIKNVPQKTGYKFYVGHASDYDKERAKHKATRDAYNQAIRGNFGIETKIEVHSQETMTDTSYEKNFEEIGKKIELVGFNRRKIHFKKKGNTFHAWILFRYPLKELKKEKRRIENLKKISQLKIKTKKDMQKKLHSGTVGV